MLLYRFVCTPGGPVESAGVAQKGVGVVAGGVVGVWGGRLAKNVCKLWPVLAGDSGVSWAHAHAQEPGSTQQGLLVLV